MRSPSDYQMSLRLNVSVSGPLASSDDCQYRLARESTFRSSLSSTHCADPRPQSTKASTSGSRCAPCEQHRPGSRSRVIGATGCPFPARTVDACIGSRSETPSVQFLFPDNDVWLALSHHVHEQHARCHKWFRRLDTNARLCFCRATRVGLLKLLTAGAVMGSEEVLQYGEAWHVYDNWVHDDRIVFLPDTPSIDHEFRALTQLRSPTCESWDNLWLIAFARVERLRLVTMSPAMRNESADVELLP